MKAQRTVTFTLAAIAILFQLLFGFQNSTLTVADTITPGGTTNGGVCNDLACG